MIPHLNVTLPAEAHANFLTGGVAHFETPGRPLAEDGRPLQAGEWFTARVNGGAKRVCLESVTKLSRNVYRFTLTARGW